MIAQNITCVGCGNKQIVTMKVVDYLAWKDGALIQNIAPYLSESERELLISQTCDTCWEEMFGKQDGL